MKKLASLMIVVAALLAIGFVPKPGAAASESGTVTAAARCSFAQAAEFQSVSLSGIDVGTGVSIEPDGSASGPFSAVLLGHSLLGQPQQITIEGQALQGAIAPNGKAFFSGLATLNLGNGTPQLSGVPFTVATTSNSLLLTIDSTVFPTVGVTAGTISIE